MASKLKHDSEAAAATSLYVASAWLRGGRRSLLLILLALGGLSFAAYEAWTRYGAAHAHWESYSLTLRDVQMTPPPAWVRSDVRGDVARIGSLDSLSLLDHNLTRQVAHAFALHPWVAKVERVSKFYPAGLRVDLAYRRPVGMVEVEHQGKPGLLPIDRDGVLLPPEDFSAAQAKSLPRLSVGKTFPAGPVGSSWDDPRVTVAAILADFLVDDWAKHPELFEIVAMPLTYGGLPETVSFEIVLRSGRRITWGRAPGREGSGEAIATEKRTKLFDLLKTSSVDDQTHVDLRSM